MSFKKSVAELIEKYAQTVYVTKGDTKIKTKAFVQPLRHQTRVYSDMAMSMGGFKDNRYYLYIGKPDIKFFRGDNSVVSMKDEKFIVHTSECYMFCDKELYVWAVLKPYKKQRRDDYDTD